MNAKIRKIFDTAKVFDAEVAKNCFAAASFHAKVHINTLYKRKIKKKTLILHHRIK